MAQLTGHLGGGHPPTTGSGGGGGVGAGGGGGSISGHPGPPGPPGPREVPGGHLPTPSHPAATGGTPIANGIIAGLLAQPGPPPPSGVPLGPEVVPPPGVPPLLWLALLASQNFNLLDTFESIFQGRPKLLDTEEAIARLRQSGLWQFQALANDLEIWVRNGVPLSTSNPVLQKQLEGWIHGALMSIAQTYNLPPALTLTLDTILWRVLASETALGGRILDQVVEAMYRYIHPQSSIPPPGPPPGPPRRPPREVPQGRIPQQVPGPFPVPHGPSPQPRGPVPRGPVPGGQPFGFRPPPGSQYEPRRQLADGTIIAPLIDPQDCPSCSRTRELEHRLERQIETETQQGTTDELDDIQEQLDELQELEKLPLSQRDLHSEMDRKQVLMQRLREIEKENASRQLTQQQRTTTGQQRRIPTIRGQQGGWSSQEPTIHPVPSGTEVAIDARQESEQLHRAARQLEQRAQEYEQLEDGIKPAAQPEPKVQFCVGCASTEDAIQFLNGEPSQCSVIPGSTKPIGAQEQSFVRRELERLPEVGKLLEFSREVPGTPEWFAQLGSKVGKKIGRWLDG